MYGKKIITLIIFLLAFTVGCEKQQKSHNITPESSHKISADNLYTHGVIWTGVKGEQPKTLLATKNGKIVYVGNNNGEVQASNTIDLKGAFMMPGFVDNHVHFFEGGAALASVDLRDAKSPEEFTQRITDFAKKSESNKWILNGNWDHENWNGELPHKNWIDKTTKSNPVFVIRLDGHMALANSAALAAAGIKKDTQAPSGGTILKDANGEPTGILKGNALNLVFSIIPQPSEQEILESYALAQSHALSLGLTKVFAVTANETETTMLGNFRLAKQRGLMKLRTYVYTPIEHWKSLQQLVLTQGVGDDLLGWGGVKGFVDGSLGAATAWFHKPYSNNADTSGAPLTEPSALKEMIAGAYNADLRLAIHAIGDKAIDNVISNYKEIAGDNVKAARFRIEHFQHPSLKAIKSISQQKIIAAAQPSHAVDDGRWAEASIGAERIKSTYAFRDILDSGAILSFGSDWPVAPLSPLHGVYSAVTRQTTDNLNPQGWLPEQKITVEEALTAYTSANAYAGFEEDKYGTLEVGKQADMVVLADDPRAVSPKNIKNIKVMSTIINGEIVYSATSK